MLEDDCWSPENSKLFTHHMLMDHVGVSGDVTVLGVCFKLIFNILNVLVVSTVTEIKSKIYQHLLQYLK